MIHHKCWSQCRKCSGFFKCITPFPIDGRCPTPERPLGNVDLEFKFHPECSHRYKLLLDSDVRLASIFHRWRRGIIPKNADFLYIRELVFSPEHWGRDDAPMYFLQDVLLDALAIIVGDFQHYHGAVCFARDSQGQYDFSRLNKTQKQLIQTSDNLQILLHNTASASDSQILMQLLLGALGAAVFFTPKEIMEEYEKLGGDWSRLVLDHIRFMVWGLGGFRHLDLSQHDDQKFQAVFEEEWKLLIPYSDIFYGFRVVPKLSLTDMVRYQNLKKGDPQIRRTISTYFTHQASEYPHVLKIRSSKFTEVAFERRIREMYTPLINSVANDVLDRLEVKGQHRDELHPDILTEVWKEYETARQEFEFYWDYPEKQRPLGKMGFLCLPQTEEGQLRLNEMLQRIGVPYQSRDLMEIAFPHYIRQRFTSWLLKNYGSDYQDPSLLSLDGFNRQNGEESIGWEEKISDEAASDTWQSLRYTPTGRPSITHPDGTPYLTVQDAARYYGIPVQTLRRLDKEGIFSAKRVKHVFSPPYPFKPTTRLYPMDAETVRQLVLAKIRLEKHSSQLTGKEIDRKTAAQMVQRSVALLRKLENQGRVHPKRKGRIVVYDEAALDELRQCIIKPSDSHS